MPAIASRGQPGARRGEDVMLELAVSSRFEATTMTHRITFAAVALVLTSPAFSHHSDAALEMDSIITIEGTVTEHSLRNPHTYFVVETLDESGESIEWTVQMGSAISVSRRGWTRDTLVLGDRVSVDLHPSRDGRPYGLVTSVAKDGVSILQPRHAAQASASTTTLEGRWFVDRSSLGDDYPGGLDQLMIRDLALTEAGKAGAAAFSQNADENPELACLSKPTPGGIIYTDIYPMEFEFRDGDETIMIRSQYFDQERTVYMDGRAHPDAGERSHEGHSIGSWEGEVLVVDTRNFSDSPSPYQNGVPSGAGKHVVERYRLGADGTRLTVEFTLEDPEYIVGSMSHTRDLIYSPQIEMTPFNCDLEATRRYLPE